MYGFAETVLGGASTGAMYSVGDGGAGVGTTQTAGKNHDREPGRYTRTCLVVGAGSSVVPVPCCFCCVGYSFAGARTGGGVGLGRPVGLEVERDAPSLRVS